MNINVVNKDECLIQCKSVVEHIQTYAFDLIYDNSYEYIKIINVIKIRAEPIYQLNKKKTTNSSVDVFI